MSVNENIIRSNSPYVELSPRETAGRVRSKNAAVDSPAAMGLMTKLFFLLVVAALALGWSMREQAYLTAKEGLGYGLGITGGVLLLLQFAYPIRKNLRLMRAWGEIRHWFLLHKMFGIVAPVLVLYHSNFKLHAVNSNVALFSMLLVVASGLVGRYIYTKIHSSHYGELLTMQELQQAFGISREAMEHEKYITRRVKNHLHDFEDEVFLPSHGFARSFWQLLTLGHRTRLARARAYMDLKHGLYSMALRNGWSDEWLAARMEHDRELIRVYLRSVARVVEFRFYRRLFSLWHTLHIPLFIMLVITGIIHVVAVHMY